jgi:hypothetical protein
MKDYKRLTERYVEEKGDFLKKGTRLTLKNAPDEEILERLAELEDKIENGTLIPKYSVVEDCGFYCVCEVDINNMPIIDVYESEDEAQKKLEELEK